MAEFYSWRPEIKVGVFLTPYCFAHLYKLLKSKSNQRTFGQVRPSQKMLGSAYPFKMFLNARDPRSYIPQLSAQTI